MALISLKIKIEDTTNPTNPSVTKAFRFPVNASVREVLNDVMYVDSFLGDFHSKLFVKQKVVINGNELVLNLLQSNQSSSFDIFL
jgi:UDP-N-acetyl-D-mannosaminuronic acid transferase (WecB/TagA/CpsF family)